MAFEQLFDRTRKYVVDNPLRCVRTQLRGAPANTWWFVPGFIATALLLGANEGLLIPEWPSVVRIITLPLILLVFPALIEEFVYRGLLLPLSLRDANTRRRFVAVSVSTAIYVAVHPISPLLFGRSELDVFLNPVMLVIVGALGYTCGYAYLRSGSLRAPILIHWATVVVWNLFLGGVR